MGKKKSKTGKQKQAKASRKFGVAVKQGKREQTRFVRNPKPRPQNNALSKQSINVVSNQVSNIISRKTRDPEHVEFDRQMASVQERTRPRAKVKRHPLALAPATLVVDDKDKSTSRLLEETTARMKEGLDGIGSGPLAKRLPTWSVDDKTVSLEIDNPYAVLLGDSSDEEKLAPPLPLFRFAPPSFSVSTTHDDIDPDL